MTERVGENYKQFIKANGGIFTSSTRKRLMGLSPGRLGWDESSADFRYNVRRYVKQALIDLMLFIDVANKKDIDQVLNRESLEPVVKALLYRPVIEYENFLKKRRQIEDRKILKKHGKSESDYPYFDDFQGVKCSEPDRERAEIASMFIQYGFSYLTMIRQHDPFSRKAIEELQEAITQIMTLVKDFTVGGDD